MFSEVELTGIRPGRPGADPDCSRFETRDPSERRGAETARHLGTGRHRPPISRCCLGALQQLLAGARSQARPQPVSEPPGNVFAAGGPGGQGSEAGGRGLSRTTRLPVEHWILRKKREDEGRDGVSPLSVNDFLGILYKPFQPAPTLPQSLLNELTSPIG